MKKLILIAALSVTLVSCRKSCYTFTIKEHYKSNNGLVEKDEVRFVEMCEMTSRDARKYVKQVEGTTYYSGGTVTTKVYFNEQD